MWQKNNLSLFMRYVVAHVPLFILKILVFLTTFSEYQSPIYK